MFAALGLGCLLAATPARDEDSADVEAAAQDKSAPPRAASDDPAPPDPSTDRKFLVGIEGIVMQAPVLRTEAARLDPRFIGRSVVMGGLGILGRYRPVPVLGIDVSVRSGSLRYTDRDDDSLISADHFLAEAGLLVYVVRAGATQLALDGGIGGSFSRVEFEVVDRPRGVQTFGSGLVRVGADVEFSFKRIAVVLSLRSYGLFTRRDAVTNRGELFDGLDARAPVPTLQTWLVGSAGIAYRF